MQVHKRKADHELASGDKVDGPPNKKLQAAATGSNASADPITVRTPGASVSTSIVRACTILIITPHADWRRAIFTALQRSSWPPRTTKPPLGLARPRISLL